MKLHEQRINRLAKDLLPNCATCPFRFVSLTWPYEKRKARLAELIAKAAQP